MNLCSSNSVCTSKDTSFFRVFIAFILHHSGGFRGIIQCDDEHKGCSHSSDRYIDTCHKVLPYADIASNETGSKCWSSCWWYCCCDSWRRYVYHYVCGLMCAGAKVQVIQTHVTCASLWFRVLNLWPLGIFKILQIWLAHMISWGSWVALYKCVIEGKVFCW